MSVERRGDDMERRWMSQLTITNSGRMQNMQIVILNKQLQSTFDPYSVYNYGKDQDILRVHHAWQRAEGRPTDLIPVSHLTLQSLSQ